MKKILITLTLSAILLSGSVVLAQPQVPRLPTDLTEAVNRIVDLIFKILIIISVILFIWGGATIATAAGDAERVKSGQHIILYALIGLAVAFISKALQYVITTI